MLENGLKYSKQIKDEKIKSGFPRFDLKVVMGPGQNFWTRIGSSQIFVGRVSHLWFGFEFGKFPLKTSNFQFFSQKSLFGSKSTQVDGGSTSYLLQVGLLFTAGQKQVRVGSGPISTWK